MQDYLFDANCEEVPQWLMQVFTDRNQFGTWAGHAQNLREELWELSRTTGGALVDVEAAMLALDRAKILVLKQMPFAMCGCPSGCKRCNFRGWITDPELAPLSLDDSPSGPASRPEEGRSAEAPESRSTDSACG